MYPFGELSSLTDKRLQAPLLPNSLLLLVALGAIPYHLWGKLSSLSSPNDKTSSIRIYLPFDVKSYFSLPLVVAPFFPATTVEGGRWTSFQEVSPLGRMLG